MGGMVGRHQLTAAATCPDLPRRGRTRNAGLWVRIGGHECHSVRAVGAIGRYVPQYEAPLELQEEVARFWDLWKLWGSSRQVLGMCERRRVPPLSPVLAGLCCCAIR